MRKPVPFGGCFTKTETESEIEGDATKTPWVFLGIADDTQSTYLRGPAEAPEAMRQAYDGNCFNATTESGVDLAESVLDLGDLKPRENWNASARLYRARLEELWKSGKVPFVAGGDHAITVPVVAAAEVLGAPIHVIQVDAHPDLYPDFEGNPSSHACTGARIVEMSHVESLSQLGIRTMSAAQHAQRDRYQDKLFIYEARELPGALPELRHIPEGASVYVTIDIDGIDPAFAPGVSHPVPGGLSARQVLDFLGRGHWNLIGMDVVEVSPPRDFQSQTAILGARLLHEGMGYAARGRSGRAR